MATTLEIEKQVAVVISILDLGGRAPKHLVLDNIDRREYLRFDPNELEMKHNRAEVVWRNDLAFQRHRLRRRGYIDGRIHNNWELTELGRKSFCELADLVERSPNLKKLTAIGRQRAIEWARQLRNE